MTEEMQGMMSRLPWDFPRIMQPFRDHLRAAQLLIMRRRNPAIHETTDMPPSPGWALPSRGGRSLSRIPNFVAVSPTSGLTSDSARFITRYIRGIFQSLPIHPRAYAPLFPGFFGVFMKNTRYSYNAMLIEIRCIGHNTIEKSQNYRAKVWVCSGYETSHMTQYRYCDA